MNKTLRMHVAATIMLLMVASCVTAQLPALSEDTPSSEIAAPTFSSVEPVVDFPEYVISGIAATVRVHPKEGEIYQELQVRAGKLDSTFVWKGEECVFGIVLEERSQIGIGGSWGKQYRDYNPIPLWMSILPPLIAIFLALLFREVLTAIFLGIFSGVAIVGFYSNGAEGVLRGFFAVLDTHILGAMANEDRLSVILFTTIIGGVVALVSKNGGMKGVVNLIARYANSARNAQFTTWLLGVLIFFDDYANTLVVGNTMRPITDKWRISREKLSYLVDSTAAPVAAIAFVTTWIGAELGYISDGVEQINSMGYTFNEGPYSIFLNSLQYAFYPVFTIIFMLIIIRSGKDFGPMYKAEFRARTTGKLVDHKAESAAAHSEEMTAYEPESYVKISSLNAIIPVSIIILGTIIGLLVSGWETAEWERSDIGFLRKLSITIGNANSYQALLWASLASLSSAIAITTGRKVLSLSSTMHAVVNGFKFMMHATLILILAWTLADITGLMHTADFLHQALGDGIQAWMLPALVFLLAAGVSFSTGSSWGTMAILYPLVLPLVWSVLQNSPDYDGESMSIFYNAVACVLAGSVLGDHCSPISDTTILSSMASSCNHMDHVSSQMPYALFVGSVAILSGTLPAAIGIPSWACYLLGIGLMYIGVKLFGKRVPEN